MGNRLCLQAVERLEKAGKLKELELLKEKRIKEEASATTTARSELKALLLGARGAGKSTLMTQARLLYGEQPFAYDSDFLRVVLRQQVCQRIYELHAATTCGHASATALNGLERVLLAPMNDDDSWKRAKALIPELWVQVKDFERCRTDLNLQVLMSDEAFSIIDSQSKPIPLQLALLGIVEATLCVPNDGRVVLVDVGGPRNERRKWIHCFSDVSAVFFCFDLSGYDERLYEDETCTVFEESSTLATELFNTGFFSESAPFLILTHLDILIAKVNASRAKPAPAHDASEGGGEDDDHRWSPDLTLDTPKLIECAVVQVLNKVKRDQPVHVFCCNALGSQVVANIFKQVFPYLQQGPWSKPIMRCKVLMNGKAFLYLRGLGLQFGGRPSRLVDLCMDKVMNLSSEELSRLPPDLKQDLQPFDE